MKWYWTQRDDAAMSEQIESAARATLAKRQERAKDAARIKEIAAFFRQHGREDDAAYIESLPSWEDVE